jgi:ABC-type branched-subunit amino acid transport system substrate-binding protein
VADPWTTGRGLRGLALAVLPILICACQPAAQSASELAASQQRGKQIYLAGTSPSGAPISARLGHEQLVLPGEAAACGGCHGYDGAGRPEGGLDPANVTWKYLTRSYGHLHASGMEHAPFDERSLGSLLRTGVYPGGGAGDPAMPVYEMSDRDLADLVAYLKRVGEETDPGLSDIAIEIATIVPSQGTLGEIGAVLRDVVQACFDESNSNGGIYGRQLELRVIELPIEASDSSGPVARWLGDEPPFALISPFTPQVEHALQAALSREGIPIVGPFSMHSNRSFGANRNVFYLYPDLGAQIEALVAFAATRADLSGKSAAILRPDLAAFAEVAEVAGAALREHGFALVDEAPFPPERFDAGGAVKRMRDAATEVVIFLGEEQQLGALLGEAEAERWTPHVLAVGALSGRTLNSAPAGFAERLYLAYPTLPQDRDPATLEHVSRLLEGNERARAHVQAVISAHSSCTLLVEALRRAGRKLGRRRLTTELEGFYEFHTGLTPPISFNANRRIGALGAYVVAPGSLVEGRLPESVEWVESR